MAGNNMAQAKKKGKIDGKLIKHAAPVRYSTLRTETTIHIKSSTQFISALKRIDKRIKSFEMKFNKKGKAISNSNKVTFITVMGMGKTIPKVLSLALHFKTEKKLKVDVFTRSIGVLDEFKQCNEEGGEFGDDSSDEEGDRTFKKRNVSCVELRIYIPSS